MRVLVYGQPWREGMPASVAAAFRKLGHEVCLFDFTRHLYYTRIGSRWAHALDKTLSFEVAWRINKKLRQTLTERRYDLVLICTWRHVWAETLAVAGHRSTWVACWTFDEPFNPTYVNSHTADAFRQYAVVFTPRGHLIPEYVERGAQRVERLPFCFDPEVHYPVTLSGPDQALWGGDAVFVGTWSRKREELLSALKDFKVRVWGHSWRHARRGFKANASILVGGRAVAGLDMSRALNGASIALNFFTPEQRDMTNVRNFEIPACGAFQSCERTPAVRELLDEGKEVACFESPEEMIEMVRYYLPRPEERRAMAAAAYRRILHDGHTYLDRVATMIELLQQA
jgi:spore maturation protein CgeB